MKSAIHIIEAEIRRYEEARKASGKNENGEYNHTYNTQISALRSVLSQIREEYFKTEDGIHEKIASAKQRAEKLGTRIVYAKVHTESGNSLTLYARDLLSPAGVFRIGSVPTGKLAEKILSENSIEIC
ncbi:MAG: hypothetical protein ACOC3A_06295 [Thermodesulfobacteriota bacterium]